MSEEKKAETAEAPAAESKFALTVRRAANLSEKDWTDERIAVIKRTVAPEDAGTAEIAMFLAVCNRYGLDPFAKEAWLVEDKGRLIIVTGRDSILKVARRDDKRYAGFEADVVYSNDTFRAVHKDGRITIEHVIEGWDRGDLVGAYCVAHKEGHPSQLIMRQMDQYKHLFHKTNWKNYPEDMLLARVITAAHRLMYNISGMYTPEEIESGEATQTLQSHDVANKTRERLEALKAELGNGHTKPPADAQEVDYEIVEDKKPKAEPEPKPAPKASTKKPSKSKAAAPEPAAEPPAAEPATEDDAVEKARARGRFWALYSEKGYDQEVVEQEQQRYVWLEQHFGKRSFGELSTFEIRQAIELLEKDQGPARVEPAAAAPAESTAGGGMPA